MTAAARSAPAPRAGPHPERAGRRTRCATRLGRQVELVEVTTEGDVSPAAAGQPRRHRRVRRRAARRPARGGVDVAVHSLKDLPTAPHAGIVLAAVPAAEDPRDVVVARDGLTLGELPAGSAGRHRLAAAGRAAAAARPRSRVVDIRGNVDTRLRQGRATARSTPSCSPGPASPGSAGSTRSPRCSTRCRCCPRPGRARWRSSAAATTPSWSRRSPRSTTRRPVRPSTPSARVLATLEAGCSAPVGALAEVVEGDDGDELWLRAVVLSHGRGRSPSASQPPVPPATPTASGPASPSRCSPTAPPTCWKHRPWNHRSPNEPSQKAAARMTRRTSPDRATTCHQAPKTPAPRGWVSFVGSGPGDPGLLTVRAAELLRDAEVVVTEVPGHATWSAPCSAAGRHRTPTASAAADRPSRRRRLRRGRAAADPRGPRQGRGPRGQERAAAWSG